MSADSGGAGESRVLVTEPACQRLVSMRTAGSRSCFRAAARRGRSRNLGRSWGAVRGALARGGVGSRGPAGVAVTSWPREGCGRGTGSWRARHCWGRSFVDGNVGSPQETCLNRRSVGAPVSLSSEGTPDPVPAGPPPALLPRASHGYGPHLQDRAPWRWAAEVGWPDEATLSGGAGVGPHISL